MQAGNRIRQRCRASVHIDGSCLQERGMGLDDELVPLLLDLPRQELDVLELRYWRYGLDNGDPQSLVKTGLRMSLTKERIRQIEEKAIHGLRLDEKRLLRSIRLVLCALSGFGGVARFDRLASFLGERVCAEFLPLDGSLRLLLRITSKAVKVNIDAHKTWALARCPISRIPDIVSLCDDVLAESDIGLRPKELVAYVCHRLPRQGVRKAFAAGVIGARLGVDMSAQGRLYYLARPSQSRLLKIMRILIAAGGPLHFRTIAKRMNESDSTDLSAHAIRVFLNRNPRTFVRFRRAFYGLRKEGDPGLKKIGPVKRVGTRVYWIE